jgi:hypothetical protein
MFINNIVPAPKMIVNFDKIMQKLKWLLYKINIMENHF